MKKIIKQLVLLFLLFSVTACQQSGQGDIAQIALVTKSHSAKKVGIELAFSELQELQLGLEYTVSLTWTTSPNNAIELTLVNRDEYLWTSVGHSLTTNDNGIAETTLSFVPQQVGKAYLKVQAVTTAAQGLVVKVFNVPYTVIGESEVRPDAKKLMLPVEQF